MKKRNFGGLNTTLIHQLKRKIEELNEEKERYTQLFEQSNDAIVLITLKGEIFGINKKTEKLTEYEEKEIVGKGIFNLFPKEKLKENEKCFMKILKEGSCFNENKIITKNGKIKDIEANAKIIRLKEGTFVQAILRDITERKKAEETLRESEEKYRTLIENSTDWIFMLDKNLKFLSANGAIANLLRTHVEKLIGKSIFEFFPKEIAVQFAKNNAEVFKTGKSKYTEEKMIVHRKEFWISTSLNPITSGGKIMAVIGITRDFTGRKRAETELKEIEEKYKAIFENAGEGIMIADVKTKKITFANPRICKILGYKEKELLKLKVNDLHPKKDLPYVMGQFKKQLQKKILTANLPVLRKDKKVIFCDVTATPLIIKGKEYITCFFLEK